MLNKEEILVFLRSKKSDFASNYQLTKLALFGSFASGEETESSDIDLLIDFSPNTDNIIEKKSTIKAIVEKHFNRKVDLCREKYIKPYYKTQIFKSAIYV